MKATRARRVRRAVWSAGLAGGVAAAVVMAGASGAVASPASGSANPVVRIDGSLVRGASATGVDSFLVPWPSFNGTRVLSLVPLQSQVTTGFATAHHCSFWAAG